MIKRTFASMARRALLRRGRALLRQSEQKRGSSADFLGGLDGTERAELAEIHLALERIERGIYGRCEDCSAAIGQERLTQCPWERRCESCTTDTAGAPATNEQPATTDLH